MRLALVAWAWVLLASCGTPEGSPSQDVSPAGSDCEVAVAAAAEADDANAAEAALEAAIGGPSGHRCLASRYGSARIGV